MPLDIRMKLVGAGVAASLLAVPPVYGKAPDAPNAKSNLRKLTRQLQQQTKKLDEQQRALREQEAQLSAYRQNFERTLADQQQRIDDLQAKLGALTPAAPAAAVQPPAPPEPPRAAAPAPAPVPQAPRQVAAADTPAQPVGRAPERTGDNRPPEVAPISDWPGVLTPRGKLVVEPSLQYAHSSNNRVALVGFTVIPAITIGLIDIRRVNRDTFFGALTTRYGITNRLEVEAKVPYVYRHDTTVARQIGEPAVADSAFEASGRAIGDVEFTGRYQINQGGPDKPYYIGTLRFKTRTGRDQFQVSTFRPFPGNDVLQRDLPTGSGFYGIQPGLTVIYPSDPAVFFGGVTYLHSLQRTLDLPDPNGNPIGTVKPGPAVGFNFGMGIALNERASLSIGYDHTTVFKTKVKGENIPGDVTAQLGTLLLGSSYRLDNKKTLNVSLGAGVTRDAPDVQLTVRLPISF